MHVVTLRRVPSGTTLPETLIEMAKAGQQAVLVAHGKETAVITASDVTAAINFAVEAEIDPAGVKIGTVTPRHGPMPIPEHLVAGVRWHTEAHRPHPDMLAAIRPLFAQHARRYAILGDAGQPHAHLVTPSEAYAFSLGGHFTLCKCAGPAPRVHSFTPSQLVVPGICNYPHKVPVTCGTAGTYP